MLLLGPPKWRLPCCADCRRCWQPEALAGGGSDEGAGDLAVSTNWGVPFKRGLRAPKTIRILIWYLIYSIWYNTWLFL